MTKTSVPLQVDDLSNFAKSLSNQLKSKTDLPGHVSLLNMLARAAGYKNYQHLKKFQTDPVAATEKTDSKKLEKALRDFDHTGKLARWPSKRSIQDLVMWHFWSKIPPRVSMTERQVNAVLNDWHSFKDPAILRRSLITVGLMVRQKDGTDYRRVERQLTAEANALLKRLKKSEH